MDQFIQRKGKQKNIFEITPTGVRWTQFVNKKDASVEHFPFENIRSDRMLFTTTSPLFAVAGSIMLLIYGFLLLEVINGGVPYEPSNTLWAILGIGSILLYVFYRPKTYVIRMNAGRPIKFFPANNPKPIFGFIEEIIRRRNTFLLNTYGTPNRRISYDAQYSNFNILQQEQIITVEEYQEKIKTLNELFDQTEPGVRFFEYSQN